MGLGRAAVPAPEGLAGRRRHVRRGGVRGRHQHRRRFDGRTRPRRGAGTVALRQHPRRALPRQGPGGDRRPRELHHALERRFRTWARARCLATARYRRPGAPHQSVGVGRPDPCAGHPQCAARVVRRPARWGEQRARAVPGGHLRCLRLRVPREPDPAQPGCARGARRGARSRRTRRGDGPRRSDARARRRPVTPRRRRRVRCPGCARPPGGLLPGRPGRPSVVGL